MLHYLRNIRKKLILQETARKYLLYAIGEILLVVVGILIAFQIDNWNEDRIKRNQEFKILTQIQSDLSSNFNEVESLLSKLEFSKSSSDSLLKSFRDEKEIRAFSVYSSVVHQRFFFNISSSAYSLLGGSLGTLITNEQMRNNIVQIYEGDFKEIEKRQQMLSNHLDQNLNPKSNQLFEITQRVNFKMPVFDENEFDFYDPINFNTIAKDKEYINTIVILRRMYTIQIQQLNKTKDDLTDVLKLVDSEISKLAS